MTVADRQRSSILIASSSVPDAKLVQRLLEAEFEDVHVTTDERLAVSHFETHRPQVLVLAFDNLEKAEGYYLSLYRYARGIQWHPHRAIVLCNKDQVQRAYELCRKALFDDYILFWPITHDATRIQMSIHHALRDLQTGQPAAAASGEIAAHARRIAELETVLEKHLDVGAEHANNAVDTVASTAKEIEAALDDISERLRKRSSQPSVVDDVVDVPAELDRLKHDTVKTGLNRVAEVVAPIRAWAEDLKTEARPHIELARSLGKASERGPAHILIVDDDEFQRGLAGVALSAAGYSLSFAAGGVEALRMMQRTVPDLVLMDIMMPGMDGIEVTRRMKASPQYAHVPIIMVTGKGAEPTVVNAVQAGAADFIVKPFKRETLLAKVADAVSQHRQKTT